MVQLVSVVVRRLNRPATPSRNPVPVDLATVRVKSDRGGEPPALMANTRLVLLPLIVTPAAGPLIVVVAVSVSVSGPPVRVIVCAVANTPLSKTIASATPAFAFAWVRQ